MKTGARFLFYAISLSSVCLTVLVGIVRPVLAEPNNVVISQVQTGGAGAGTAGQEFIAVTNASLHEVDVTGWCLYYASATNSTLGTRLVCLESNRPEQRLVLPSYGSVQFATEEFLALHPDVLVQARFSSGLSSTGGHIHLWDGAYSADTVGWGTAQHAEGTPASAPGSGKLLQRIIENNYLIDTDNNAADFTLIDMPVFAAPSLYEATDYCLNNDAFPGLQTSVPSGYERTEAGICVVLPPPVQCDGIELSEILPNPSGADDGVEFIELRNTSTVAVDLAGCELWVDDEEVALAGEITPGALYVHRGTLLPNTAGASVTLIATGKMTVRYPADMRDDISYAYINGVWAITNRPTPGAANLTMEETVAASSSSQKGLQPCPPGKARNPATNRCRNTQTTTTSLVPCAPGQYRSPETKRCRALAAASSTLKPCAPNQIRNPETNRCKAVASAANVLKPCDKGEERNPETNRCRKITGVAGAASAINPSATEQASRNYWILAGVLGLASMYGVYEYREDIARKVKSAYQRIARRS